MMSFREWLRGEQRIEFGYDFTPVDNEIWLGRMKMIGVVIVLASCWAIFMVLS